MLTFLPKVRPVAVVASVAMGILSLSCRTSNQAFLHYERPDRLSHLAVMPARPDSLPLRPEVTTTVAAPAVRPAFSEPAAPGVRPHPLHLQNPEASHRARKGWLKRASLTSDPAPEYAPRHQAPAVGTKRVVPGLAKTALAGGVLSQGVLLLGTASGAIWVLAIMLPLASVLMGVAGLAQVSRRPEKYMGKGWAMAGIMLATGALGLALVAAAALVTSQTFWK